MNWLKLKWNKLNAKKIIGQNELLPDTGCLFYIMKVSPSKYFLILGGRYTNNNDEKIIVNDPETARGTCENYLNFNIISILRKQVVEIERSNIPRVKTAGYYRSLIEQFDRKIKLNQSENPLYRYLGLS